MHFVRVVRYANHINQHVLFPQIAVSVPSAVFLFVLPQIWGLMAVWLGLTLVMTLRMGAGFWRYVPDCPELF